MADLAARVGSDEARLGRTIVRINTIESTSPMSTDRESDEGMLPAVLLPSEPRCPTGPTNRAKCGARAGRHGLPAAARRRIIGLYYSAKSR